MNKIAASYRHFVAALSFLTRLPWPGAKNLVWDQALLIGSLTHYPSVGWLIGLVQVGLALGGIWLRLDNSLVAILVLAFPFVLNRFLHFDGLADVLDGFLTDKSPQERLEIMKDSRNGSFATGGAGLFLLAKFVVLLNLLNLGWPALALVWTVPIISRWLIVPMAYKATYPRPQGTGMAIVGKVSRATIVAATIVATLASLVAIFVCILLREGQTLVLLSWVNLAILIAFGAGAALALVWMFGLRLTANRKIGGVTGDVLGCLIETAELAFLAAAFVCLHNLR